MNIEIVGRCVLLAVGGFFAFGAIWPKLKYPKDPNAKTSVFLVVFAVLCAGLGTFGQRFMPQYASWLEVIKDMVSNPGQESYAAFLNSVGKEKIPEELQKIGINYVVSHPIEGMETILNSSIKEAQDNENGEKVLKWALESYRGKQNEVDYFVESKVGVTTIRQFEPATRQLIYNKMQRLPEDRKRILEINADSLLQHKATIRPFPTKIK